MVDSRERGETHFYLGPPCFLQWGPQLAEQSAGYSLLHQPRIQERLALIDEKLSQEAREYFAREYALEVSLYDDNPARIMCVEKPHKFRGFADQVKMIEAGWKRLKLIDTPRIVNNATAGAVAAGSTMAEIYKSKWLRDKEAKLAADLEAELPNSSNDP